MNLRVDLIHETEQRSALPISIAFMVRTLIFTVVAALALTVIIFGKQMRDVTEQLHWVNEDLNKIQPQHDQQVALSTNLNRQKIILTELEGWKSARIPFSGQLLAIQELAPPSIQLTELRIERVVLTVDKKAVRVFKLLIKGRASSARADAEVDKFRQNLTKHPAFQPYLQEIIIPPGSFRQDPDPKATKTDRIFEIVCKYKPLKFE